jgi:hypothetical protein
MASPLGDACGAPFSSAARTTILLAGLTAVAAGALLYVHLKQKHSVQETQKREARRSASRKGERLEKPQSRWKVVLADNQRGPFVHLKRPGQGQVNEQLFTQVVYFLRVGEVILEASCLSSGVTGGGFPYTVLHRDTSSNRRLACNI